MKAGWHREQLRTVTTKIGSGATPLGGDAAYKAAGISLIRSLNVHDTGFRFKNLAFIDDDQADRLSNVIVEPDDVLLNITGASIARCCVVPDGALPARVNQHVSILRPIKERILPKLLYYMLTSKTYKDSLLNAGESGGSTRQALTKSQLQDFWIECPRSIPEQHRIVAILDEAFDGIATVKAKAEKNLQNARELVEAGYRAIVTHYDKADWSTVTVSNTAATKKGSMRTGPFGSQLLHSEFVDDGIAVLGIDNAVANEFRWDRRRYITQEKFAQLARYRVYPGDVLITIMGTCGRCAVVPSDIPVAINTKHLCCITLDQRKCLPRYLHIYFLHDPVARDYLSSQASGSVMDGLNMGIISEMPVQLPPIDIQSSIVSSFDGLIEQTKNLASVNQRKLSSLDELKQSLLHRAFNGDL